MLQCRCRAEKFGVEYKEPERRRDLRHAARKEKALQHAAARPTGFNPGLDLFSEVPLHTVVCLIVHGFKARHAGQAAPHPDARNIRPDTA